MAPRSIWQSAKAGYRAFRFSRWHGLELDKFFGLWEGFEDRECNICGYRGPFQPAGLQMRIDAQCRRCGSFDRHRLLKLVLDRHRPITENMALLHFAPEKLLADELRRLAGTYTSADIRADRADTVLNIEAIDQADGTTDAVVCSHVLEHVDDQAALAELYRILRPGGLALLMVPMVEGWEETHEDPWINGRKERVLHYGQRDHVRMYGRDFRDRVQAAGFTLEEFTAVEPDVSRYALQRGEKVFLARKSATSG